MCAKTQTLIQRADEAKRRIDDAIRYFDTLIRELEGDSNGTNADATPSDKRE